MCKNVRAGNIREQTVLQEHGSAATSTPAPAYVRPATVRMLTARAHTPGTRPHKAKGAPAATQAGPRAFNMADLGVSDIAGLRTDEGSAAALGGQVRVGVGSSRGRQPN